MKKYIILMEKGLQQSPYKHELTAANIMTEYFESNILFLRKGPNSSADLRIMKTNQIWELKSPLGGGKRTIANILREASHQSKYIILDLSRCKMNNEKALSKIRGFLNSGDSTIKKLIVIDKSKKVIDILDNK